MIIKLRSIDDLLPHEEIIPKRLEEMKHQIQSEQAIDYPIIIDKNTGVIIDGHHRYTTCLEMGLPMIPVLEIDYFSDNVWIEPFRIWEQITKQEVIRYAQSRKRFPPKTTKHCYTFAIQPIHWPL